MDVTQQVGGPIRQGHGHQQIRQVVMGHHQGRHRFVGIMPVGKLLAGKPQRLLIAVERAWRTPRIEMAVATQGLRSSAYAAVRSGGTDPPFTQVPVMTRPLK